MKNYENPSSCFVVLLVIIHEQVIYQLEMYFRNLPRGWDVLMYDSYSCMLYHYVLHTTANKSDQLEPSRCAEELHSTCHHVQGHHTDDVVN